MVKTIPVIYRDGVLIPQVALEDLDEGQRFDIQIPEAEELDLPGDNGGEPWVGFTSTEDALQVVEQTAGSWGSLSPHLAQWIIESDEVLENDLPL